MPVKDFKTLRLCFRNWRADLADEAKRSELERRLGRILSPAVLEHLPEPLQFAGASPDISEWVSARASESEVFTVSAAGDGGLLGLLLLAFDPGDDPVAEVHIGYLLAEEAWGKGYATELVRGLTGAFDGMPPTCLVAGVGKGNGASAKVLLNAGFRISPDRSTSDADMFERPVG